MKHDPFNAKFFGFFISIKGSISWMIHAKNPKMKKLLAYFWKKKEKKLSLLFYVKLLENVSVVSKILVLLIIKDAYKSECGAPFPLTHRVMSQTWP